MQQAYTLSQLAAIIKEVLNTTVNDLFWIKAEISELHENRNGNCYLELIEKESNSERIITKFRALIWANTYRILKPYFEQTTQAEFKAGINILIKVKVEYSELYGITLIVHDIDPSFTLGDFELRRTQVIQQLMSEGIFDMNKQLPFALVPQRIAVISSETAAGYQDFINHLQQNDFGFKFYVKLFKAYMQGDEAELSIINALDNINNEEFDVVVITRGGGSKSDLACFDRYLLASHVCQFPLPIISAIGHERDVSIVDMVANTRVKTPTAAAQFLIDKTLEFWNYIFELYENIINTSKNFLENELDHIKQAVKTIQYTRFIIKEKEFILSQNAFNVIRWSEFFLANAENNLNIIANKISVNSKSTINKENKGLDLMMISVKNACQVLINKEDQKLLHVFKYLEAQNPRNVLKKGYSITQKNGRSLKSCTEVNSGDEIITILYDGEVVSYVK